MDSLEIRTFSESIRKFVNESPLPAEVKKIVLKDILGDVSMSADAEIIKAAETRKREEQDAESVHS